MLKTYETELGFILYFWCYQQHKAHSSYLIDYFWVSEGMVEQMAIHTTHIGIVLSS